MVDGGIGDKTDLSNASRVGEVARPTHNGDELGSGGSGDVHAQHAKGAVVLGVRRMWRLARRRAWERLVPHHRTSPAHAPGGWSSPGTAQRWAGCRRCGWCRRNWAATPQAAPIARLSRWRVGGRGRCCSAPPLCTCRTQRALVSLLHHWVGGLAPRRRGGGEVQLYWQAATQQRLYGRL